MSSHTHLGNWWDLLVVIVFNLVIFQFAVQTAMSATEVKALVEVDRDQLVNPG